MNGSTATYVSGVKRVSIPSDRLGNEQPISLIDRYKHRELLVYPVPFPTDIVNITTLFVLHWVVPLLPLPFGLFSFSLCEGVIIVQGFERPTKKAVSIILVSSWALNTNTITILSLFEVHGFKGALLFVDCFHFSELLKPSKDTWIYELHEYAQSYSQWSFPLSNTSRIIGPPYPISIDRKRTV